MGIHLSQVPSFLRYIMNLYLCQRSPGALWLKCSNDDPCSYAAHRWQIPQLCYYRASRFVMKHWLLWRRLHGMNSKSNAVHSLFSTFCSLNNCAIQPGLPVLNQSPFQNLEHICQLNGKASKLISKQATNMIASTTSAACARLKRMDLFSANIKLFQI